MSDFPAGGRRDRLIKESFYHLVTDILDALGWLAINPVYPQITVIPKPVDAWEEVPVNTIAVFFDTVDDQATEIGSNATDDTHGAFVDFYAWREALGIDVIGDIRAALQGKRAEIGRTGPILPVYDWSLATPTLLFHCDIENVRLDRARDFRDPARRYWFSLSCDIVDEAVG